MKTLTVRRRCMSGSLTRSLIVLMMMFFTMFATVSCCHNKPRKGATGGLRNFWVLQKTGDALEKKILLTEIREGRLSNAVEAMEFSIDCAVVALWTNAVTAADPLVLQTLRAIKEYRQKYPREIPVSEPGSEFEDPVTISKKATEILNRLK